MQRQKCAFGFVFCAVMLTVDSLSVLLLLAIKDGVFVLWQHLLLGWHLVLPALNWLDGDTALGECLINDRDNSVDSTKALALTGLLVLGEPPWDLPVRSLVAILLDGRHNEMRPVCQHTREVHRIAHWLV